MKKIDTVIFDIGRVLVEFDWKKYLIKHELDEIITKQLGEAIFESHVWKERDRGEMEEEEYLKMAILQAPHLEEEIKLVFKDILNIVEVYPFATEWVKSIKEQGKKIYLLSNYSKASYEHDVKKFEFIKYVDGWVISYEINSIKPEEEIYKSLIEKYNIKPENAVFLDDVKENTEAAKAMGLNVIHVRNHEQAVEALKDYGIKAVQLRK